MSGLNINEDKTNALWIGSMSRSDVRLWNECKLDWEQGPIKILGVIFTPGVFDIWDLNSELIITKMEILFKSLSERKLTLPGKITVIKYVVFSKFIHLFIALPNPPERLIKQLDKYFYNFLWTAGPDRISRNTIIQAIKDCWLKMIKTTKCIQVLKITWLRRLKRSHDCSWTTFSHIDFSKRFAFGVGFANLCATKLHNPCLIDTTVYWIVGKIL